MRSVSSPSIHRLGALSILILLLFMVMKLVGTYVLNRIALSTDRSELERSYQELLARRVDIAALKAQLSALNGSNQVRMLTVEAPNSRAALMKLQQLVRSAIESTKGKVLSATESATGQEQDVVRLLVRARVAETMVSELFSNIENGSPHLHVEEVTLTARPARAAEPAEVEATMTIGVQWIAGGGSP